MTKESHECEVIIVGGGPVGLMSAFLLSRFYDVKCFVLEKKVVRESYSRAFGVTARSMELFDAIDGVGDVFRAMCAVGQTSTLTFHFGTRELRWKEFFAPVSGMRDIFTLLPQSEQEKVWREMFGQTSGVYMGGMEFVSLQQTSDGRVTVTAMDKRTGDVVEVLGKYVIGADGGHSAVRKAIEVSFDGFVDDKCAWIGDVRHPEEPTGDFAAYFGNEGEVLQIHIAPELSRFILPWHDESHLTGGKPGVEDYLNELRARSGKSFAKCDVTWVTNLRVNFRIASSYRVDNVFLAGDAAHVHSPAGGQGLNTGYQDAINLCWKLGSVIKHGAPPDILDTYETERKPVGIEVLARTNGIGRNVMGRISPILLKWIFSLADTLRPCWWEKRLGLFRTLYQAVLPKQDGFGGTDMWRGYTAAWSKVDSGVGFRFPNLYLKGPTDERWLSTVRPFDTAMWIYVDGVAQDALDNDACLNLLPKVPTPSPFDGLPIMRIRITFSDQSSAYLTQRDEVAVYVAKDTLLARTLAVGNSASALYFIRPDGIVGLRSRPASHYLNRFQ